MKLVCTSEVKPNLVVATYIYVYAYRFLFLPLSSTLQNTKFIFRPFRFKSLRNPDGSGNV